MTNIGKIHCFVISATIACTTPSIALDGEILITQEKALAGGVTPGDAPGFPVTITTPGSYRLASNLTAPAGVNGIHVKGVDATLDLNGFTLSSASVPGTEEAIGILGEGRGLTVRNGNIRRFLAGVFSRSTVTNVDRMRMSDNSKGVYAEPTVTQAIRVTNSTIAFNSSTGIECGRTCHIEKNNISRNGGPGVHIRGGAGMVLGNAIISNGGPGILATSARQTRYVGAGNNSVMNNNGDATQISGPVRPLVPNACGPEQCP